jgi:hypothetical protein
MDNPSSFSRADVINLFLILVLGAFLALHVWKSQDNHELIAKQEAAHISAVSAQIKSLQAQIKELKTKSGTTSN